MDLKSGHLAWPETLKHVDSYSKLNRDLTCDVVVIGGGMGGIMMAYELSKQGKHVVLVEKHQIGHGSSSANTGLLQFCNDKSLTSCIHTYGEHAGVRFYQLCKQAIEKITRINDELEQDTEFTPRRSLYYASSEEDVAKLKQEYDTLARYHFPVEWWEADQIEQAFGFTKPAAIITHGDAEVNPYRFIHAMASTAVRKYKLEIYESTEVVHHEFHSDFVTIITAERHRIMASHAVFAMGYETQEFKRDQNAVLTSTYALVTAPIPDLEKIWHQRMLVWETARPYNYMRTTPDNRIVAGGLDESTAIPEERDRMFPHKIEQLRQHIAALFPSLTAVEADYSWAATFGSTHDGYPMIGPHPRYPRCLFIEGYGGNGTVYCAISTEIIPALINHGSHPDASLFSLTRSSHPSPD